MTSMEDRYYAAMHAMQSGVQLLLSKTAPYYQALVDMAKAGHTHGEVGAVLDSQNECSPKMLRTGVNSALIDSGAIQKVLIDKGLVTRDEILAALVELTEQDVESYRRKLGLPPNVSLG